MLVGHSYGGTLITKAGTHDSVGVLVYKTKPSWCIDANNDRTVNPDLERAAAKSIEGRPRPPLVQQCRAPRRLCSGGAVSVSDYLGGTGLLHLRPAQRSIHLATVLFRD